MSLGSLPGVTNTVKVEQVDIDRAERLKDHARRQGVVRRPRNSKYWSEPFGVLRRKLGRDHSRIDRVLDAYIDANLKEPKCCHASCFVKNFENGWIERELSKLPKKVKVSPEAQWWADHLHSIQCWPNPLCDQLVAAMQYGMDNLVEVKNRLLVLASYGGPTAAVARRLVGGPLENIPHFVGQWFSRLFDWIARRKAVNADLFKLAPGMHNPDFVKALGAEVGGHYRDEFNQLMEAVREGSGTQG